MNLEHKFQVNFPNHNFPKMFSRVENEVTKISRSFSTLTLYTQKLKVANTHIKNFYSIKYQVLKSGSQNLSPLCRKLVS